MSTHSCEINAKCSPSMFFCIHLPLAMPMLLPLRVMVKFRMYLQCVAHARLLSWRELNSSNNTLQIFSNFEYVTETSVKNLFWWLNSHLLNFKFSFARSLYLFFRLSFNQHCLANSFDVSR